jgi:hypothetical protein
MVDIQSEFGAIKIGPEMYDDPYNNKTLFVLRIVTFNFVVASR